jgi:hypothetical protein
VPVMSLRDIDQFILLSSCTELWCDFSSVDGVPNYFTHSPQVIVQVANIASRNYESEDGLLGMI